MFDYLILSLSLVIISFLLVILLKLRMPQRKALLLTTIILLMGMLVFNGYLTSLPIVEYNSMSVIGIRIGTIPIEDFSYLIAVIILIPAMYEYFCKHEKD